MINVEDASGPTVKDLNSMIEFPKDGIVSKVFLDRPETNMTLFCMSKGQEITEHTSSKPAAVHVLQGKGVIYLGNEKYDAEPGLWIFMPPEQKHAMKATEDFVFLLTLFKRY